MKGKMEGSSGHHRPDLQPLICYKDTWRLKFGRENKCTLSHTLDDSPPPNCVSNNLTVLGWLLVYKSRNYLGLPPSAEQSLEWEELKMKQLLDDMAHVAHQMAPRGMVLEPAMTIVKTLADCLMRVLLMLQTARSTPRPRCLCCQNPPLPNPRICDLSFKSVVWLIGDGVPIADVSILPPIREFDPPAYVTLTFQP